VAVYGKLVKPFEPQEYVKHTLCVSESTVNVNWSINVIGSKTLETSETIDIPELRILLLVLQIKE
jgi:hypothetical protein